jgi:Fe-S-cluster containining protein
MEPKLIPIDSQASFAFACGPGVACFNACCHDLNHFLYPYDLLRLCRHLALPSDVFLQRYVLIHQGPQSGLPVATLRLDPAREMACPFVAEAGCRVYADRPAACRLYPLARAVTRCAQTGRIEEHFALLREPHCRGHGSAGSQTVAAWVAGQGLAPYHRMNDPFMAVIAAKRRAHPGSLSLTDDRLVQQALYDPDRFRRRVLSRPDGDPLIASPAQYERVAEDDEALLQFGYRWVVALLGMPQPGRGSDESDR